MAKTYYPPNPVPAGRSVFLAGSIEMGKAVDWQNQVIDELSDLDINIMSPRRADWDSSQEQSADNPYFAKQVEWELDGIEGADFVFFFFDPQTKSPITLLELGLVLGWQRVILVCPDGYWRKGNVQITAGRHSIAVHNDLAIGIQHLRLAILGDLETGLRGT